MSPGRPNSTPDWHSSPPVCGMFVCVWKEGEEEGRDKKFVKRRSTCCVYFLLVDKS